LGVWSALRRREPPTPAASRRDLVIVAIPAAILTATVALGVGNYGLLIRQRSQIVLLAIPFVALGWVAWKGRRLSSQAADHESPEAQTSSFR
jgi:hypothetical protein